MAWKAEVNDAATGDVWMTNDCAIGGPVGLHVNDAGVPGGRKARIDLRFDLPRDGEISGYVLNRAVSAAGAVSGYTYAAAVRETDGISTYDQGCASYLSLPSFDCSNLGSHVNPLDPGNEYSRTGLSLDGLSTWAGCISNGCAAPFMPPAARFTLHGSVVSIVDDDPPTITGIDGALARPEPVSGLADLFVDAADIGAGVMHLGLSIDGNPSQTITVDTTATCVEPFELAEPCPAQLGRIFTVDTSNLTPGPHSATGTVTDGAGNTTPFGPVSFVVAQPVDPPGPPGPKTPDNGLPAVSDPVLTLDRELVEHAPGKTAAVTGRLATTTGEPVVGARLEVVSTSMGGRTSVDTALDPVVTDGEGRFAITAPGDGARRIGISFSAVSDGPVTRRASATVRSLLKVKFKARPRKVRIGKSVRFTGRITGGGASVAGANTEIQAISDGRWQTVANVTARKNGTFRWKYRFRHVDRNAIFTFRALVRANPGWPWPTVNSGKLKVRIRVPGS